MRFLGRLFVRIPRGWLDAFGAALGWLVWTLRIRRRVVLENLRLAFPEKPEEERREIARRTYRNLGQMIPDFLRVPFLSKAELEKLFVYEGWDRFEEAMRRGKGVIACTGHFGNFDLLASAHSLRGVPMAQLARKMGKSRASELWRAGRRRSGVEEIVVSRGATLAAAIRSLKEGRVLGYPIDQNQPARNAIFPSFFGIPAATAAMPAVLSLRSGIPVIFALSVPLGDGRHRVVIEGPLDAVDTGDRDADILRFSQDLNDRLERWIRLHPDRWYWLHRRWKTRPEGEVGGPRPAPPAVDPPDGAR